MAQDILYTASTGYATTALVSTNVLAIPATVPAVGRTSVLFIIQSSTPWFAPTPLGYLLTFTPNIGDPVAIDFGGASFTTFPVPTTIANIAKYQGGIGVIEDTSGGVDDRVASGGVISLTTLDDDAGVFGAVVLQADSPLGYVMRPVGLGGYPTSSNPPAVTSATMGAVNKSTGPFLTFLVFTAANGGSSPGFTPSDVDIALTPLIAEEANNAVLSVNVYISPTAWGVTPATWFVLPASSPSFTIPTTWTGATYAYQAVTYTIGYQPLSSIILTSGPGQPAVGFSVVNTGEVTGGRRIGGRSFAQVVGD